MDINPATFGFRLDSFDEKLENHGRLLERISTDIGTIAVQTERLNSITTQQEIFRRQLEITDTRINLALNYQASCPRRQLTYLWMVVFAAVGTFGSLFLAHILSVPMSVMK